MEFRNVTPGIKECCGAQRRLLSFFFVEISPSEIFFSVENNAINFDAWGVRVQITAFPRL